MVKFQDFHQGYILSGSNNVLTKNLNISNNKIAIYITGTKFTDINNNMLNNNTIGISSHSNNQTNITIQSFKWKYVLWDNFHKHR